MLHITVLCFLGSYLVAFALELGRLWGRSRVSRIVMIGFGLAGFAAHTIYLLNRFQQTHLPPLLSSTHDWMQVLAWVLVLCYLFVALTRTELAVGLFLLPVVLLLVASTYFLSQEPNTAMNAERARRHWGMLHASLLVFGIAAGASGFLSGLMYLVQHHRLKTRHGEQTGLKMPSLARLAQVNRWSVMLAFLLLTLGFASGIILALLPGTSTVKLADPGVVTSALVWLILAGLFAKLLSHRAPTGRQVAWLTICGCGFLLLTLIGLQVITGNVHSYSGPGSRLWAPATDPSISLLPSPPGRGVGGERELLEFRLRAARGLHAPASPRDARPPRRELQRSPPPPLPGGEGGIHTGGIPIRGLREHHV
jgi:ABC-type uncharacterized transport system permease subunit